MGTIAVYTNFAFSGAGNFVFESNEPGGTISLWSPSSNTYTGTTTVKGGTLVLDYYDSTNVGNGYNGANNVNMINANNTLNLGGTLSLEPAAAGTSVAVATGIACWPTRLRPSPLTRLPPSVPPAHSP